MDKPRPKLEIESEQYTLCRRLEEYIEYATATKRFADVGFYETLIKYIDNLWIKPSERLPDIGDLIAVKWSDEDGDHGYGVFIYDELNATSLCLCDIWMKLPETECIAPNAEGFSMRAI